MSGVRGTFVFCIALLAAFLVGCDSGETAPPRNVQSGPQSSKARPSRTDAQAEPVVEVTLTHVPPRTYEISRKIIELAGDESAMPIARALTIRSGLEMAVSPLDVISCDSEFIALSDPVVTRVENSVPVAWATEVRLTQLPQRPQTVRIRVDRNADGVSDYSIPVRIDAVTPYVATPSLISSHISSGARPQPLKVTIERSDGKAVNVRSMKAPPIVSAALLESSDKSAAVMEIRPIEGLSAGTHGGVLLLDLDEWTTEFRVPVLINVTSSDRGQS